MGWSEAVQIRAQRVAMSGKHQIILGGHVKCEAGQGAGNWNACVSMRLLWDCMLDCLLGRGCCEGDLFTVSTCSIRYTSCMHVLKGFLKNKK